MAETMRPGLINLKGVIFDVYDTLVSRTYSDEQKLRLLLPPDASFPSPEHLEHAATTVATFYAENRHLPWALDNNLRFWKKFYDVYLDVLKIHDPDQGMAYELAAWSRSPNSYVLDPDAITVLTALRQHGFRLGLLSNWDTSLTELCADLGLADLVDLVLASDEIGIRKPDRRIFIIAAQRLGLPPQSCLYVGDSLGKDVGGAKKADMKAVWLNPTRHELDCPPDREPDLIITRLHELLDHLVAVKERSRVQQ
ncbi:HAD family hydrolase [bacterium]|nr:HAD family hydrolase [bacterium]